MTNYTNYFTERPAIGTRVIIPDGIAGKWAAEDQACGIVTRYRLDTSEVWVTFDDGEKDWGEWMYLIPERTAREFQFNPDTEEVRVEGGTVSIVAKAPSAKDALRGSIWRWSGGLIMRTDESSFCDEAAAAIWVIVKKANFGCGYAVRRDSSLIEDINREATFAYASPEEAARAGAFEE